MGGRGRGERESGREREEKERERGTRKREREEGEREGERERRGEFIYLWRCNSDSKDLTWYPRFFVLNIRVQCESATARGSHILGVDSPLLWNRNRSFAVVVVGAGAQRWECSIVDLHPSGNNVLLWRAALWRESLR